MTSQRVIIDKRGSRLHDFFGKGAQMDIYHSNNPVGGEDGDDGGWSNA